VNDAAERVLNTVSSIPGGHVMTYGDVAEAAGTGARAVGQVLRNGGHDVPWWRVVDAVAGIGRIPTRLGASHRRRQPRGREAYRVPRAREPGPGDRPRPH
jgi:alkylated DNA nucleotide flippase Atl1